MRLRVASKPNKPSSASAVGGLAWRTITGAGAVSAAVPSARMDEAEAQEQCERLRNLINRGPGRGLNALHEAIRIVATLRHAAAPFPHARLTVVVKQLRPWFIANTGYDESGTAGLYLRDWLMEDITMVEKTWKPWSAPDMGESMPRNGRLETSAEDCRRRPCP